LLKRSASASAKKKTLPDNVILMK